MKVLAEHSGLQDLLRPYSEGTGRDSAVCRGRAWWPPEARRGWAWNPGLFGESRDFHEGTQPAQAQPTGQPPGYRARGRRAAEGLSPSGFHVHLVASPRGCYCIYPEHGFQLVFPFLILHLYYDAYLLIHLHFEDGVCFIASLVLPVLTRATNPLPEPLGP